MPEYRSYGDLDDRIANDGDVGFIGFNNRLRPDQLAGGMLTDAQNVRLDRNGEAQVRKGIQVIEAPFAVGGDVFRLPEESEIGNDIARLPTTIESASLTSNVVSLVLDEPAVELGYNFQIGDEITVEGIQFTGTDPNGTHTITGVTDAGGTSTITYALPGADETYTTAIVLPEDLSFQLNGITTQAVVGYNMVLDQGNVTEVYASTAFSDPNDNASQYILIASNAKVVANNLLTNATTDITYPAGETVPPRASMLQAFNKVFIFRNGQTALEWDGDFNNNFELVESGEYSQPTQLSPSSFDITDGKATATFSNVADLNGTSVGDTIEIEAIGNSPLVVGEKYVVSERDNSVPSISFFVQHEDTSNSQGVIFQQEVSVGLGFIHMPAPEYAVYHQRRLLMPFRFIPRVADNQFDSTGNLDEIIASDILDSDTYDRIYAQYRFNAGEADFNVGLHSFAEDKLMVFNRNSIHLVQNTTNLQGASTQLLTNEVGCVARQSIVQVGNRVIFLSDNGVYGTEFLDEYNLRGTETPLSEPINESIKRINRDQWSKSVAVYFDNRYFIAVPVNGSLENNVVLIYNFLNKQWESIDSVDNADWDIENLIVAGDGNQRGVYAINKLGGIHRMDQREQGDDLVNVSIGGSSVTEPIKASVTTRQYTLGSMDRKKWKEFEVHVESSSSNSSDLDISAETENPDASIDLGSLSSFNKQSIDETVTLAGFDLAEENGVYVYDESRSTETKRVYIKGNLRVNWIPSSIYLETTSGYSLASSLATTATAVAGDEWYDPNGELINGSSLYTQGGDAIPTNLPAGEDVSIRGRIGNRRGHGIQFTFNNTTGRPRIRAVQVQGSESFRSTQKAI
jgi:hypothetical protein